MWVPWVLMVGMGRKGVEHGCSSASDGWMGDLLWLCCPCSFIFGVKGFVAVAVGWLS